MKIVIDDNIKVRTCPQSLNDNTASFSSGIFCQKLIRGIYLHIGNVGSYTADQIHPFLLRKHGLLSAVDHHADDQSVKNICCPANDVQMTAGNRVKTARIDGDFHNRSPNLTVNGKQGLAVFIILGTLKPGKFHIQSLTERPFRDYYTTAL